MQANELSAREFELLFGANIRIHSVCLVVVVVVSHFIVVGSYVVFLLFGKIFLHNNYTVSCLRFTCHSDMVPCVCVCVLLWEQRIVLLFNFWRKKIYVAVRYIFGFSLLCMCCYSFFIFWSTWSKWKLSLTQSEFKVKKNCWKRHKNNNSVSMEYVHM